MIIDNLELTIDCLEVIIDSLELTIDCIKALIRALLKSAQVFFNTIYAFNHASDVFLRCKILLHFHLILLRF